MDTQTIEMEENTEYYSMLNILDSKISTNEMEETMDKYINICNHFINHAYLIRKLINKNMNVQVNKLLRNKSPLYFSELYELVDCSIHSHLLDTLKTDLKYGDKKYMIDNPLLKLAQPIISSDLSRKQKIEKKK